MCRRGTFIPHDAQVRRISWVVGLVDRQACQCGSSCRYCRLVDPRSKRRSRKGCGAFSLTGLCHATEQHVKEKAPNPFEAAPSHIQDQELLDLGFLEFDVLLGDRIILGLRHLVRHGTAVLRGDVEETCVSRRQQLDLDGRSFRHSGSASKKNEAVGAGVLHGEIWREITNRASKVNLV
jgi:hypothetical protein